MNLCGALFHTRPYAKPLWGLLLVNTHNKIPAANPILVLIYKEEAVFKKTRTHSTLPRLNSGVTGNICITLGLWKAIKAMHGHTWHKPENKQLYWRPFLSGSQVHRPESWKMRCVLRAYVQWRWQKLQVWLRKGWVLSLKIHLSSSLHNTI